MHESTNPPTIDALEEELRSMSDQNAEPYPGYIRSWAVLKPNDLIYENEAGTSLAIRVLTVPKRTPSGWSFDAETANGERVNYFMAHTAGPYAPRLSRQPEYTRVIDFTGDEDGWWDQCGDCSGFGSQPAGDGIAICGRCGGTGRMFSPRIPGGAQVKPKSASMRAQVFSFQFLIGIDSDPAIIDAVISHGLGEQGYTPVQITTAIHNALHERHHDRLFVFVLAEPVLD